ncbi:flagellar biosynthesis protein FlhA [Candidatus Nucleicultrix amoebiphila FS5]|uniref:Flagellar biosynthesis protein FlhA n=2 Tax=Candidatus Nucleicultrix TaxID=1509243 RepID=A0A1W6N657_9PROT|nr:flagellar biosynthesis protein FlhA [Candidatus Nucleicultrix amoebiphila FS5]
MAQVGNATISQTGSFSWMASTMKRGDIAFALGLISIIVVLIMPMPKWLLDMSLAISLAISGLVLMTVLFIEKPLEFSSFPIILLTSTMLRLSLNVASTRLILTYGHEGPSAAGEVIRAFGAFIMQGNFVIGLIVFGILVIVNFVVITKGSGRIAEVSARFTLDAMPGKQMAIDADLSSGLINEDEARKRRKELEGESSFFGAMDGAAKFVRGDAIAGLCITFINIIGGIIIGVAQRDLSFADAAQTYTLLTVGDGLVSQIPALVVSTAAGMLVSKISSEGSAEKAVFAQLSAYPTALGLSSFLMVGFSILPGIPMIPFLFLALITGAAAWRLTNPKEIPINAEDQALAIADKTKTEEETLNQTLHLDQVRLELGYGLLPLVNSGHNQKLTDQIKALRKQLAKELGFLLPTVRIQDNLQLPSNSYVIRIKEVEVGRGDLRPHMLLVLDPEGKEIRLAGESTIEPTFGLRAMWINLADKSRAEEAGYTVVDPMTVISTHLSETIKDNSSELLTFTETQKLLDEVDKPHQKLVSDMVPSQISMSGIQRVLQNLLAERVSIRDLSTILEGISEACSINRNTTFITEHVRMRLSRQICATNSNNENVVTLVTLSPEWEKNMSDALVSTDEGYHLALAPSKLQEFATKVREIFENQAIQGENPVLLTSANIRPHIRSIIERFRPLTTVLSQNEIHPKAKIKTVATI